MGIGKFAVQMADQRLHLRSPEVIDKIDIHRRDDLVRCHMDGDQSSNSGHAPMLSCDLEHRLHHRFARRLANQQAFALAGQQSRGGRQHQADADGGHAIEFGHGEPFGC